MHPGAGLMGVGDDLRRGIERARIHVARLDADDSRLVDRRQGVGAHPPLIVDRYADNPVAAEPQHG